MWLSILIHVGTIAGVLAGFLFVGHILRQRRPPAASLGWILFVILVPYAGIPLYLALGTRKLSNLAANKGRLFRTRSEKPSAPADTRAVERVLASAGIPAATTGNQLHVHANGRDAREVLFALIDSARREVAVCTFILGNDRFGQHLMARLTQRVEQGIQVRLLLDGVGSFLLPRSRLAAFLQAGGKVAWFIPVIHRPFRGRTILRNHRKYAIADRQSVWTGGRNLAGEYFPDDARTGGWVDLSFDLSGPAAGDYQLIFEADWAFATRQPLPQPAVPDRPGTGSGHVQVVPAGPDIRGEPLRDILLTACFESQHRILAVTPYYVPDEGLQEALCLAAERGLTVDLILPRRSNHRLADLARRRYLEALVDAGARIWLIPDVMVHAKGMVFDDSLALAGSANLDRRSLFLNFEVMSLFLDLPETAVFEEWLTRLRDNGQRWYPQRAGRLREALEGLVLLLAFQL
jgi:cardiolipin synthase